MKKIVKVFYSLISLTGFLATPVTEAAAPEQAIQQYQKGDYENTASKLKILSDQGHADAQFYLATMYHEGKGVEQDYLQAAYWFRAASNQGHAKAQFNLGNAYKHGRGVKKDDWLALTWWKRSALQSYEPAQYNYGIALLFGRGTRIDEKRALDWLSKAANSGYAPAQRVMSQINGKNSQTEVTAIRNYHSLTASSGWLRDRPARHFTIQMMAGPSESNIKRFWQANKINQPAAIFRFKHGQSTWHGLVIGDFESPALAQRAIKSMPESMLAKQPWVRRFDSVQKMLVNN
ncbi:MAG TPA: hypothetical protein ENI64_12405 [Gammaproteobacteria bacterium]|nr:hypothetical protein [Gammaproteobacteria bacterium]